MNSALLKHLGRFATDASLLASFSLLAATGSTSGAGQDQLSLKDAVSLAAVHRPELRAASARLAASQQLRRQAGLSPNPRFYFQTEDLHTGPFDFGQNAETYAYFSQVFETSGRRAGRVAVANEGSERSRLEAERTRREIELSVKQAYWAAETTARIRDLYMQDDGYFHQVIAYQEARLREGKLAEIDLLRVRLEDERIHAAAGSASLDTERALLELSRAMGVVDTRQWILTEDFEALNPPSGLDPEADPVVLRPEGQIAHEAIAEARANLRLQKAAGRPDLEALFGYKRNAGFDTAITGLQINLPLFDRNQGGAAAAEAQISAAKESFDAVHNQLLSELSIAKREYEMRRDQYSQTFKPLRDQAVEISDITRAAYREGGLDLVRLLDAERLRIEAEISRVGALGRYHQSVVVLEYAKGVAQ